MSPICSSQVRISSSFWVRSWPILLFGIAVAAQMPTVFRAEFIGEDEMLFTLMGIEWIRWALGAADALERITAFYYPPLQSAIAAPLIWIWGPVEWAVRLPGALCAAAASPLLYTLMRREGATPLASGIAAGMLALCSVLANHAYALTCGLFIFGATLSACGLARFVRAATEREADRGWLIAAIGWVLSALSLPDAFFYLPVLALAYGWRRQFRITGAAFLGMLLILGWIAAYALLWIYLPSVREAGVSGGEHKIKTALSSIGTFRLGELIHSFASGSSWIAVALSPLLIPLGWRSANRGLRWVTIYFALPLGVWTFVLDYANVRSAHMLLSFPAFAALWGGGAMGMYQRARRLSAWAAAAAVFLLVVALASGLWQSLVLHVTDRIPASWWGPSWWVLRDVYPQNRRLEMFGQHAAAVWIDRRAAADQGVVGNLGGSFASYYAARFSASTEHLDVWARDPNRARADRVRFYVHSLRQPPPQKLTAEMRAEIPVAANVWYRGAPILEIYDLWGELNTAAALDLEQGRRRMREIQNTRWKAQKRALRSESSQHG